MDVTYSENNSGGYWWLSQSHYDALRAAGWVHDDFMTRRMILHDVASEDEAIASWEAATGLDASDPGCSCCGPPHNFY